MNMGKIVRLESRPSGDELNQWFPGVCWHFIEQPESIGIGQNILTPDRIGLAHQYGRIFSHECEIRWEQDRFWIAREENDGVFDIVGTEISLRGEEEDQFKKLKALHYFREGVVVYTRFKEAVK